LLHPPRAMSVIGRHTLARSAEVKGSRLMRYIMAMLVVLAPLNLSAATNEETIQLIISDYQAQCMLAQEEFRDIDYEEDDPVVADLSLPDSSIYEIIINGDGQTATVLYANFHCTNIGSAWCGTSGCTAYMIIDGMTFQTEGFKPVSVVVSENDVAVIVPRSGGACVNTTGQTPSNNISCYAVAVWDDHSDTFNSIGSGDPVFRASDFMP